MYIFFIYLFIILKTEKNDNYPHRFSRRPAVLDGLYGGYNEQQGRLYQGEGLARGRGDKKAREEVKQVQTSRQELTVGLEKRKIRGKKISIFN